MMILTDDEIAELLQEPKPVPSDLVAAPRLKPKKGHREIDLTFQGKDGSTFCVSIRQANVNPLDFSVILSYQIEGSYDTFRLRRYNGKAHEHRNRIEGVRFYDFHIHTATERYQQIGATEDAFAEPTHRYADLHGAIRCMLEECGFEPATIEGPLFGGFR